ncbi:peptidase S41 family protein [Colletotrichum graminicola M1.001]|uniref:Peptidase S41 family protein n=1 Tax=Colletotrichum graminicola (strain M1.001 / M2 / FGSC 10212) TaxID=645133 RepID=E3QJ29_COLGM|nr:peptidase S41 family protein [Colletotrichum graminicola M1.001]EFQ30867.1 peptidase S41 family protein [Colletotrichum graminicola M1.001]
MLFGYSVVLLCVWLGGALARPSRSAKPMSRRQDGSEESTRPENICGEIIDAVNEGYRIFYASDAYLCLTSVPYNDAVALRFIEYYNTTMQFQSTLAYLKNPPQGYQQPAFDLVQGLSNLKQNVTSGVYKNQYDFEADLQYLVYSVHDAHVDLSSGILSAFSFASPFSLVTASTDGKETPKVYFESDVIDHRDNGTEISAISHINGEPSVEFLTRFAALNSVGMLEPHADWNQIMGSPIQDIQGALNIFSGSATFYPGDSLNFTYENPDLDDVETSWLAIYNNPEFSGPLTTGGDFYNYFVLGLLPASYDEVPVPPAFAGHAQDDSEVIESTPDEEEGSPSFFEDSQHAFPSNPDVVQARLDAAGDGGVVTGYFYEDISTAVLSIPHFDQYGADIGNFSDALNEFVSGAQNKSLSRLVIDLSGNYGGSSGLAFLLLRTLFPGIEPFAGSRRRSHELGNVLGSASTRAWQDLPTGTDEESADEESDDKLSLVADEWVIVTRLNAETGRNYSSWEEYQGPLTYNGDDFTRVERYDLANPTFHEAAFDGWLMNRYIDNADVGEPAPWSPGNVVILTDGSCSSACALFVEMATTEAKARTIVVGGAPKPGPMQAVGGTRGARLYSSDLLDEKLEWASEKNETAASRLPAVRESGMFINFAAFNLRDQLREDDTKTPLQFRYVAADCRLYYTLDNVYNMTALWRDAARAAFDDESLCVEGSTGYTSRNGTTPKSPPRAAGIRVPAPEAGTTYTVDPDPYNQDGLPNAQGKTSKQVVPTLCDLNDGNPCPGGGVCKPVRLTCSDGNLGKKVTVCVPQCQLGEAKCPNANQYCKRNKDSGETKTDTFTITQSIAASTFKSGKITSGVCLLKVGTAKLGCPR